MVNNWVLFLDQYKAFIANVYINKLNNTNQCMKNQLPLSNLMLERHLLNCFNHINNARMPLLSFVPATWCNLRSTQHPSKLYQCNLHQTLFFIISREMQIWGMTSFTEASFISIHIQISCCGYYSFYNTSSLIKMAREQKKSCILLYFGWPS